ncbi:hypothetical protein [Natrinema caseinilyticum]|uniref:hypothetical protein n=1 Tax=Natrinema caseinilyticum TaxID=2961570 RepID=UPI0020C5B0CD|nr:hypothetical protein [Natrinema caseinilyticum]
MYMTASELRRRSVTVERVESVTATATVRHVDQLDSETLAAFYEAVTDDRPVSPAETILEEGEIIVFTDYYRVERV